jgi:hypothetical protein
MYKRRIDRGVALCAGVCAAIASCSPPAPAPTGAPQAAVAPASPAAVPATPTVPAGAAGAAIADAKALSVGMADSGEIAAQGKSAFYRFDNKLKVRDLAIVRLENQSSTLKPDFKVYDQNRSQMFEKYDGTPGASADAQLTIEPGRSIYVEVLPYGSAGKYRISVATQNAADQFEPNDDILSATPMQAGKDVLANVMDDKDTDFYKVSGAAKTPVIVTLDNQSATLKPDIKIFDANKSQVMEKYDATAGANLSFSVAVEPGKDFYIEVLPYNSSGKYRLGVK